MMNKFVCIRNLFLYMHSVNNRSFQPAIRSLLSILLVEYSIQLVLHFHISTNCTVHTLHISNHYHDFKNVRDMKKRPLPPAVTWHIYPSANEDITAEVGRNRHRYTIETGCTHAYRCVVRTTAKYHIAPIPQKVPDFVFIDCMMCYRSVQGAFVWCKIN